MSKKNYTVYHLHSDLSNGITNIDSITKYYEYIEYAASLGMKAIGFSEHGCIFEWVHKKTKIESLGMKYIHSQEFYITATLEEKIRDNYHCVLIAKNYDGVCELNELSSKAFNKKDNSFYYLPRISLDDLISTSKNIILTTACIGGILYKGNDCIKEKFLDFLIKNKERCFLEIQHHQEEKQIEYNKYLYSLSLKHGIPLIAGTDTHVLNETHLHGRHILQLSKKINFDEESSWDLTFKTYDELVVAYEEQNAIPKQAYIEAINNTNLMADMIEEFELDYSTKYPVLYPDSMAVFKKKIIEGVKWRGVDKYINYNEYKNRIQYELETYKHNKAIDFMLLEEDYKRALREKGIKFGYSRGSVSGSVIAYLLGITEVDSIKFNLNFERFMNCERVSLADIDTDWFKGDRGSVREYLYAKEGLHCCDIITFNTIAMKGSIRDVARALDFPIEEAQTISNAVKLNDEGKESIDNSYREKYPELFKYVDIVTGTIVSVGSHAAGLVVSPHDVNPTFGTFYNSTNQNPISQINMKEIDSLNYVKLDVLGLDCVGLINQTCELAGIETLTPDNMKFDDMNVWNSMKDDFSMIFQFESDFAGSYLQEILKDSTIEKIKQSNPNFSYIDLMSMANGAIRPAGASYRNELSQGVYRDNGHEVLNEFLSPTLGYLVYQEQIIEFLNKFCGFTMGEADIVRRGFAKKSGTDKFIPKIKDGFCKTMKDKYGVEEEEALKLIENFLKVIIDASSYLFSKNHADPYSFLGYACGYLRHYHPLEFLTAAMNIYKGDSEKTVNIKEYAKKKNIEVMPIKFGKSKAEYFMDKDKNLIYQGISGIKYCNEIIAGELYDLKHENKYTNFIEVLYDIKSKTSVDVRQLKILTGLNFFIEFGNNKYLLDIINLFDNFSKCKIIKKSKLDGLGLSTFLMKKYADKETEKQYSNINNLGLINELCKSIPNKSMHVKEQVKFEMEFLECCIYTNPKVNESFYIVTEFKQFKDPSKPYIRLHNIKTGLDIKTRIKQGRIFKELPFGLYNILLINDFAMYPKTRCIDGQWVKTDELEQILEGYEIIQ